MKIDHGTALITGASAGIGREFARLLAPRVKTLVLVARRDERLRELKEELRGGSDVHTRIVDLAKKSEIDALVDWLGEQKIDIDLLINNAGLGDIGAFSMSDPDRVDRIIQVNMRALTLLTRALLPQMIARKRGGILNVSSSAAFLPIADFSVYAASKSYVNSFSEGLRAELRGTGVSVCALCPGPVRTEFMEVAKRPNDSPYIEGPGFVHVSAADVARAGLRAFEHDKPFVIPGWAMKIGIALVRLTPLSILRLFSGLSSKRARSR